MHSFDLRRVEWALTEGDRLVDTDPLQSAKRWTLVSLLMAALLVATVGVLGIVRGHADWRDAELVLETDSGALFLNRDGVLHPVPNYTSALLLGSWGGARPEPRALSAADLADAPRGSQLGIVGAPSRLPTAVELVSGPWAVCGRVGVGDVTGSASAGNDGSVLLIGRPAPGRRLSDGEAVLAVAKAVIPGASPSVAGPGVPGGSPQARLIWGGRRFAVDLADPVIESALRLAGLRPSVVDLALLNLLSDAGPVAVPTIPGLGEHPAFGGVQAGGGRSLLVGDVFVVRQAGGTAHYVVHRDGIEQISETVAELLRFSASTDPEPPAVAPAVLARLPVTTAPIGGLLPGRLPVILEMAEPTVVCVEWDLGRPEARRWAVTVASELPPGAIEIAGHPDGAGVSRIGLKSGGGGALVSAVATADGAPATVYLVSDAGVAFPLAGDALVRLGYPAAVVVNVNAPLLDLLPKGPVLEPVES